MFGSYISILFLIVNEQCLNTRMLLEWINADIVYFREMKRWRWYVVTTLHPSTPPPPPVMWPKEYIHWLLSPFIISKWWKKMCLFWTMPISKLWHAFNRCYASLLFTFAEMGFPFSYWSRHLKHGFGRYLTWSTTKIKNLRCQECQTILHRKRIKD